MIASVIGLIVIIILSIYLIDAPEESLPKEYKNIPELSNRIEGNFSQNKIRSYWFYHIQK